MNRFRTVGHLEVYLENCHSVCICVFVCVEGVKVENKQLLVDKFIPKVTSAVPGSPPAAVPPGVDVDTVRAPLVYAVMLLVF